VLEASDSKDAHFSATWNGGTQKAVAAAGGSH
jgi:hypothetical protein